MNGDGFVITLEALLDAMEGENNGIIRTVGTITGYLFVVIICSAWTSVRLFRADCTSSAVRPVVVSRCRAWNSMRSKRTH